MVFLFYVVASGLFAALVLDEAVFDEGGDVALDGLLWDAGGVGDLRDGVAGVGGDAGEDDTRGIMRLRASNIFEASSTLPCSRRSLKTSAAVQNMQRVV